MAKSREQGKRARAKREESESIFRLSPRFFFAFSLCSRGSRPAHSGGRERHGRAARGELLFSRCYGRRSREARGRSASSSAQVGQDSARGEWGPLLLVFVSFARMSKPDLTSFSLSLSLSFSKKKKKKAVVGAGAAGLAAARELSLAGHQVTVFERGKRLGGLWSSSGLEAEGGEEGLLDGLESGEASSSSSSSASSSFRGAAARAPRVHSSLYVSLFFAIFGFRNKQNKTGKIKLTSLSLSPFHKTKKGTPRCAPTCLES